MTEEDVYKIFREEEPQDFDIDGDTVFIGLKIISKYTNNLVITARHDILFSETVEKLLSAGMGREEFIKLRQLNWMISAESLSSFV